MTPTGDRLRIVEALASGPATASLLSSNLGLGLSMVKSAIWHLQLYNYVRTRGTIIEDGKKFALYERVQ